MKITQSAKEKTKIAILKSAVELITQNGFENVTLREIAKNAGVSNPTIYNYFPSKEKLLYSYIELKHQEARDSIEAMGEFHTYSLREQLQTLVETELELYLEDREFVVQIADMVFHPSGLKIDKLYATNELFVQTVSELLDIAIEAGEIHKPPFGEYLPRLFWDYYIMVVAYWLKDESESFENTTQFVDHSMGVIEAILHSDILSRMGELGMFFFKTHLLGSLQKFSTHKERLGIIKRKLGEVLHD